VLSPGTITDEAARKHLRKEALALSKLNHPNIATVYDFDTKYESTSPSCHATEANLRLYYRSEYYGSSTAV
jgi:serine/threonine protein kinase